MRQASLESLGLAAEGDRALLGAPRRALLISRTPKRPAPATPWVRAVVEAAQASAAAGEALVCGAGRAPFDVALAVTRRASAAALVVLDERPSSQWREAYAPLLPVRHLLVWPERQEPGAERLPARDVLLGELSTCAWMIHVRPGGNMASVRQNLERRAANVDARFALGKLQPTHAAPAHLNFRPPSPRSQWSYLTHYTREPDGLWPDETPTQYAEWLAFGPLEARREAVDALRRILSMRRVLGSGRLMPAREPLVSFTARPPWELGELVRWRRGLARWTFRPYGLAVRRDVLEDLGARPVRYACASELKTLPPGERLFAQKHEPPKTDWSGEAEWRLRGDLSLEKVPNNALRILVPTAGDASAINHDDAVTVDTICD